jgi:transposase, IS6 family
VKQNDKNPFRGRRFTAEIILWAVRWRLPFPISYRDHERRVADRGVQVDHTTLFGWIEASAPERDKRLRPHPTNGSWHVGETCLRVKGEWLCLCRAVDAPGQRSDFPLWAKRDAVAARRFFREALRQPHAVDPRTITVDRNAAHPIATKAMRKDGTLRGFATLRQVTLLNAVVEQDHRRIERLARPGLGFKSFATASQRIAGYEVMAMVRKVQAASAPANDRQAQTEFIATRLSTAARTGRLCGHRLS